MAWACMVASVGSVGSLIFIDDVTHDDSSRMNSVYKNILSANLQRNASDLIGSNFFMQQGNEPKRTANTTKDLIREKKWKVLDWPSQSPDLEHSTKLSMHLTS